MSVQLLALKSSSAVTVFCASGAAAETADMSGLSAGMRTSGSGHGWPMRHEASKYQGFKEYGPESAKLGSARRQGAVRRSVSSPARQQALMLKHAVFVSYGAD